MVSMSPTHTGCICLQVMSDLLVQLGAKRAVLGQTEQPVDCLSKSGVEIRRVGTDVYYAPRAA